MVLKPLSQSSLKPTRHGCRGLLSPADRGSANTRKTAGCSACLGAGGRGDLVLYLGGLGEDELGVLHQALQGHGHVNHLHLLVLPALVIDKFPVPSIHNDKP